MKREKKNQEGEVSPYARPKVPGYPLSGGTPPATPPGAPAKREPPRIKNL
jgi:hypothetical protein